MGIKSFLKLILLSFLFAFVIYVISPVYRYQFHQEDKLIENITAITYLITFFINLKFNNRKNKPKRRIFRLISIISIIGFLDEISFGTRLFNINFPYYRGTKIDSLHNILSLIKSNIYKFTLANKDYIADYIGIFIFAFIAILIIAIIYLKKYSNTLIIQKTYQIILKKSPIFVMSIITICLLFISQLIDLYPNRFGQIPLWAKSLEEIFEMYVSFCLLKITLILKNKVSVK